MSIQNFTTTLLLEETPKQVFEAVLNPQDWWSGEIVGSSRKLNDEFTYQYKEFHLSKQRVVEMIPNKKVVWLVTESQLNFTADKSEWTGTKIIFEISLQGSKTALKFTHEGLNSQIECYDNCSVAWTQLIQQGLRSLITTGKNVKVFLG